MTYSASRRVSRVLEYGRRRHSASKAHDATAPLRPKNVLLLLLKDFGIRRKDTIPNHHLRQRSVQVDARPITLLVRLNHLVVERTLALVVATNSFDGECIRPLVSAPAALTRVARLPIQHHLHLCKQLLIVRMDPTIRIARITLHGMHGAPQRLEWTRAPPRRARIPARRRRHRRWRALNSQQALLPAGVAARVRIVRIRAVSLVSRVAYAVGAEREGRHGAVSGTVGRRL